MRFSDCVGDGRCLLGMMTETVEDVMILCNHKYVTSLSSFQCTSVVRSIQEELKVSFGAFQGLTSPPIGRLSACTATVS